MSQALYRKYRSRSFDEIVGQKGVVKALSNALKTKTLSHAYLFTGPRGVGKTSIARIFAFAINNTTYTDDTLPVDIIEIDAASNRGIDEVRDLRDKVRIAPVVGPYKVYIIDEVHMLTTHAFNALLKTLEEPPAHVIFILATTESHKLPETVTSRTQRYNFTLASIEETAAHLKKVAKKEGIVIEDEALRMIAKSSAGSLRDALSLLDHAKHLGSNITVDDVRLYIGVPNQDTVDALLDAIKAGDGSVVLGLLDSADTNGVTATALASATIQTITVQVQNKNWKLPLPVATQLLQHLLEVEQSAHQEAALRLAFLTVVNEQYHTDTQRHADTIVPATQIRQVKSAPVMQKTVPKTTQETPKTPDDTSAKVALPESDVDSKGALIDMDGWTTVLEDIRMSHNTLYSFLRMANVDLSEVANNKIMLEFQFPFHKKRVSESKNREVINSTMTKLGFDSYEIVCEAESNRDQSEQRIQNAGTQAVERDTVLHQIRGVFGSAEVLE